MNSNSQNGFGLNSVSSAESSDPAISTLRLIANLPVPDGLEDRVLAHLKNAPRPGRVLAWPDVLRPSDGWLRSAAAAAIVFVVAGGGWSVYMRVQPSRPASAMAAPAKSGGFSSAGAMRTPQTLPGPVIAKPAAPHTSQTEPIKKTPAQIAPAAHQRMHALSAKKATGQAAAAAR